MARLYRFPGMDPWLEDPYYWVGVHDALIVDMARAITAQVAPRYVAWPGHRLVLEAPDRQIVPDVGVLEQHPDMPRGSAQSLEPEAAVTVVFEPVEVKQSYIMIRDLRHDRAVVTVVEILSPSNKRAGTDARRKYLRKQEEVAGSDTNLVEIDLLRGGEPTVAVPPDYLASLPRHDYRVVVRRAGARDRADVHPIPLRRRLPRIGIPLRAPDPDAVLDLQALIERVYKEGAYGLGIDYGRPAMPALSEADAAWAHELLKGAAG